MQQIKYLLCGLLFIVSAQQVFACDACGCVATGSGVGLLNQSNKHFVALQYSRLSFRGVGNAQDPSNTRDFFHQTQINARYHLSRRLQVMAIVPYKSNIRTGEVPITTNGLGDISFSLNVIVLKKSMEKSAYRLDISGGVELPTGAYQHNAQEGNQPNGFNIGTGSLDFLWQTNFTWQYQNFGSRLTLSGKIHTENDVLYRFGNQTATTLQVFWRKESTIGTLVPFIGMYGEFIDQDALYGYPEIHTGGQAWYTNAGLQFTKNQIALGIQAYLPVQQNYAEGATENIFRVNASVAFLF